MILELLDLGLHSGVVEDLILQGCYAVVRNVGICPTAERNILEDFHLCLKFAVRKFECWGVMNVPTILHGTFVFIVSKNRHASAKSDFEKAGEA